jgi:hypothetical protein
MSPNLPNYVEEYGPREPDPPPFVARDGNFLGLILKGKAKPLEELCDRALNEPFETAQRKGLPASPFTYKPICDAVLLLAGRWEGLISTPLLNRGKANEDEVSLWVPLKKFDKKSGEEQKGVWATVPYLFVNNPMSVLSGREDYGYQKAYGKLQPSPLPGKNSPAPSSVAVKAFGGAFGGGHIADWVPGLRVDPVATTGRPAPAAAATDCVFPGAVLGDMLCQGVNQVFLKQFRDAEVAGRACLQQLIEARATFEQPQVKLKPGVWRVQIQIPDHSSHPITEDLGVETQVTPFAFELQSGLKLDPGKIICA